MNRRDQRWGAQGLGYDVGAYEWRAQSSVRGDLDGDGQVTLADLRLLIQMLTGLVPVELATADLDGDGQVTLADVRALILILVTP